MAPRRDNMKAVEARDRKAQIAQQKKEAELKAKEEAKWKDEGTKVQRQKDARKHEADAKADEARRRREEKLLLEKQELNALQGTRKGAGRAAAPKRLTQYEIMQRQLIAKREAERKLSDSANSRVVSANEEDLLVPNPNHLRRLEVYDALLAGGTIIHATGIDEALEQLGSAEEAGKIDMHPERRARVAFKAFEERELARLREEFPGLKRSQYNERIHKLWLKSPENPLVKE